jgi:hypothetical protein
MQTMTQGSLFYLDWFQRESFSLRAMGRELGRYLNSMSDDVCETTYQYRADIDDCIRVVVR